MKRLFAILAAGCALGAVCLLSCRITDETRTWEEIATPDALPSHSILILAESAALQDVVISNGIVSAAISPRGAELRSIRKGGFEYMWQNEPDHPSGIAPVLFPICGNLFQGRYTFDGREYEMPGHGFAKTKLFSVERSTDGTRATFTLESNDATRAMYPFDFTLSIAFRLDGQTLHVQATVRNNGAMVMPFAYGAHPGFNVPLEGKGNFEDWFLEFGPGTHPNAIEFGRGGFITGRKHNFPLGNGAILPLRHDLFNHKGLFLDQAGSEVSIRSEKSSHSITVRFPDMRHVGFWHAPGDVPFLCIEPWSGLPSYDGVPDDFATRSDMVRLAPGAETTLRYSIELR